MASGLPEKRKRGEESPSGDSEGQRASPHRPGNLSMAQNQSSRGGLNTSNTGSSDVQMQNAGGNNQGDISRVPSPVRDGSDPSRESGGATVTGGQPLLPPTSAPQQRPPQPSKAAVSQPRPTPRLPYEYENVTDSIVAQWESTGKQKIVTDGQMARVEQNALKLASLYQELINSGLSGRLQPESVGIVVKEIIGENASDAKDTTATDGNGSTSSLEPRELFLDVLSIVTDADPSNIALKPLVFSTGISDSLMRLQLETPLLQSLGLVRETFTRMGIRKQTNLLYRQSNYNLLREESEGYSKLLTELFTTSNNEPPTSEVVEETFERVKAMIGAFDMDVGRVLDVTLDVFAAVLVKQYRFFVKLLRASSWWPKEDKFHGGDAAIRDAGLPNWALPGSAGWATTDEERAENVRANEHRDKAFWERVRHLGMRAFFEIGRRAVSEEERKQLIQDSSNGRSEEEEETRNWIQETGTLPPKGNRVAAQLLGFKLRFYSSRARGKADVLPDNLIYLAALLIKVGFVSLRDLYPHLWRSDDSMDVLKEEKMKEKAEREQAAKPGGGINALMTAGALSDDTVPFHRRDLEARAAAAPKEPEAGKEGAAKEEEKDDLPEPVDQKVLLLKSLLAIGALPESLFILSKFPWIMDVYPELPEFIHRILHQCLSPVYNPLRPLTAVNELRDQKQLVSQDQTSVAKGHIRLVQASPRRTLRWAQLDKEDTNDGTDYRFYWDDWADNIPLCQTVDDVFALCSSLLNLSGHKIGQDPTLLAKLVRIGKHSMANDDSQDNKTRWKDLCKRLLVPSVSLTKANPGVVNELFQLVSLFPREARYNMYAEWHTGQTSRMPDISTAFNQARAETKDVLKRLSKTNIRPMARALAKIAYANPGVVIITAINQIESYENLIEVVVECARYFTYLGYDILSWALISSLGQKGRSRVQDGGLLTSRWLNALSTFAGRIYKRYSVMDPAPVLQYVAEQLRHNNCTDLIVLEQVIRSMGGIITDSNFNDAQLQAMGGGELLQGQTLLQLLDKRHESKSTSKRLIRSLSTSTLAGRLLVSIAQERVTCVFREGEESSELKLMGNVFDEIHRVLTQYLDLLRSNLPVDQFDLFVPSFSALVTEFGIQPEIAFWISRPSISKKVEDADRTLQEEETAAKAQDEENKADDAKTGADEMETADESHVEPKEGVGEEKVSAENTMDIDNLPSEETKETKESKESKPVTEQSAEQKVEQAVEQADQTAEQTDEQTVEQAVDQAVEQTAPLANGQSNADVPLVNTAFQELVDQVTSVLPQDTWEIVGPKFYTTFWQLSLYDVHVPGKAYEDEVDRLKRRIVAIQNDRTDISLSGTQRKERDKKQIGRLQEDILDENKSHLKFYSRTRLRLQKEKDTWFAGMRGKHDALNVALLEQCFLPRLLLSPIDAFYCFKVLKFLHTSGTANFRTVGLLDQLFRDQRLTAIIFLCTSKEADHLGRFLNEVLRDLARWHTDKGVYEKEAFGVNKSFPGFAKNVDPECKPVTFLDYEDFRRLLYKWHRLLAQSLKTCFSSGEYMHIRNAISVLKAVVQCFPAVNWIGRDMLKCVNDLSHHDKRDDVKIPAASLIGDLNRRERKWIAPQAFMIINQPVPPPSAPSTPKSTSGPAHSKNEAPPAAGKDSNSLTEPNARTAPTSGVPEPHATENKPSGEPRAEVEDGEIRDAKMTDVTHGNNEEPHQQHHPEQREAPLASASPSGKSSVQTGGIADVKATPSQEQAIPADKTAPIPESQNKTEPAPISQTSPAPATTITTSPGHSQSEPNHPERARAAGSEPRVPRQEANSPSRLSRQSQSPRRGFGERHRDADHFRPSHHVDREPRREPSWSEWGAFQSWNDEPGRSRYSSRPSDWSDRSSRFRSRDIFHGRHEPGRMLRDSPLPSSFPLHRHDHEHRPDRRDNDGFRREPRTEPRAHPSGGTSPQKPDLLPAFPHGDGAMRPFDGAEREALPRPDAAHGRLRDPDVSDAPSGPRASGQTVSPAASTRGNSPGSGLDRQPPTAPANRLGSRVGLPPSGAPSAPESPSSEKDTTGIHPDRLRIFQQSPGEGSAHGMMRVPPGGVVPPSGPRAAPSGTSPRSSQSGFGNDRGMRGDKRFAGINSVLQQGSGAFDRGTSIRGRASAGRQPSATGVPPPLSVRSPVPSITEEADRPSPPTRSELMFGRSSAREEAESGERSHADNKSNNTTTNNNAEQYDVFNPEMRGSMRFARDERDRERDRDRGRDRERDRRGDPIRRDRTQELDRERSRRSDGGSVVNIGDNRRGGFVRRDGDRRDGGYRDRDRMRDNHGSYGGNYNRDNNGMYRKRGRPGSDDWYGSGSGYGSGYGDNRGMRWGQGGGGGGGGDFKRPRRGP